MVSVIWPWRAVALVQMNPLNFGFAGVRAHWRRRDGRCGSQASHVAWAQILRSVARALVPAVGSAAVAVPLAYLPCRFLDATSPRVTMPGKHLISGDRIQAR